MENTYINVPATYFTMNQVLCRLPSLDSYLIDISNDGHHVTGRGRSFVPHDPVCHKCTQEGHGVTCIRKVGFYQHGECREVKKFCWDSLLFLFFFSVV